MQNTRIRLLAVTLSLALHGVWLIQSGGTPSAKQADMPAPVTVTRLSFAATKLITPAAAVPLSEPIVDAVPVALQEAVMPAASTPEPITQKPKPVKKRKPEKKREPVLKAKRKPAPIIEGVVKIADPVEPVRLAAVASAALPPAQLATAPSVEKGVIERQRQRYLAALMAHIEKHKWYPATARRRGIQGKVKITFLLMADGSIRHVEVEDGPTVLRVAAEQAVAKAGPMSMPPATMDCPFSCAFSMQFALN